MKYLKRSLLLLLFTSITTKADTPSPSIVKAKTFTGDGVTGITATGTSLNVNVTNSGGLSTVDQGNAGLDPWLMQIVNSSIPVTGTFWQTTQPVSIASIPLASGAATSANQSTEISSLATIATNTTNAGTPVVSGTVTANQGTPGVGAWPVLAAQVGTWAVSAGSLPLPSGAATETTLSAINTKIPALGQALASASTPVVLTAAQLSTLTPLSTVTANAGTGTFLTDGSAHAQPVTGTFWQTTQPVSGTFFQATQPVSGTFWQATQPVSVSSLPLPSGAATESTLSTMNGKIPTLGQALAAASVPVVLTSSQLSTLTPFSTVTANAGSGTFTVDASGFAVPVTGTFWQTTQPVSLSSLPALATGANTIGSVNVNGTIPVSAAALPLPSGASTSANQSTEISSLASIDGKLGSLGQTTMSGSAPVVIASNQSAIPITGSISVTNSANGAPGSSAPSEATQVGGVDSGGDLRALNVATDGTLIVDGSAVTQPVSAASLPLPSGAATESTLGSIDTKTPALGQALAASSVPVVLTAAQISTLTPLSTVTANAGSGTFTVDGSGHTQPVSGTFWQVTQPVSIATAPVLVAGSSIIGKVGIDQTTPGTTNGVQVNAALPAGSNVIGHVIADSGSTTAVTSLPTLPAGSNVIGHVIADTGSTTAVTALPAIPSGSNVIGHVIEDVPAATTVKQAAITIGTSAVRLTTDGSAPSATRSLLAAQLLTGSTALCYFGSSSVTSTSATRGVQMFAGQTLTFDKDAGDYYAICDTASQTFLITEQE